MLATLFRVERLITVRYGTEFIMEWRILPISDSDNQTTHFLAVQREGKMNNN